MKTTFALVISLSAALNLSLTFAQTTVTRKVLMSLQAGERIVTNESCIELSYTANQLFLVTQQGQNVYTYENGQRKGPFKSLDQVKTRDCGKSSNNQSCAVYDPDEGDNQTEFVSYSEKGEMVIKFKGKSYGPYKMVNAMHVPADKSWFVSLVTDMEMKCSVVSSDMPPQPVEGNTSFLQVSKVGKNYLTAIKDEDIMNAEMMKLDFSKMTQDDMMKVMQQQADKKKNAGPPKAYVYSNGKKFGPFPAESIYVNNPAFCQTGGGNWYMTIDNALYINGKKVKEFSSDDVSISTCNVWISSDGARYAVITYRKIIFSDGTSYPAPVKLETENKEGKSILKWISLENEKDLVAYIKEL